MLFQSLPTNPVNNAKQVHERWRRKTLESVFIEQAVYFPGKDMHPKTGRRIAKNEIGETVSLTSDVSSPFLRLNSQTVQQGLLSFRRKLKGRGSVEICRVRKDG